MADESRRFEVEIPATIKDETDAGAKSVRSSVEKLTADLSKLSERSRLAGQAHWRLVHQQADQDARQQEARARAALAALEKQYNADRKLREEAARDRRRQEAEEVAASNRRAARARQQAKEEAAACKRREACAKESEQEEATASNRRRAYARQQEQEEATASNRRAAYAKRQEREEEAAARSRASRTRQAGMGLRNIGTGIGTAGALLTAGLTMPIVAGATAVIEDATKIERYRMALVAITGSAEAASAKFEELYKIAKMPGLTLDSAIEGQIRLQDIGFGASFATKTLRELANAVALTGQSTEKQVAAFDGAVNALGQLSVRGKLTTQSLRVLMKDSPVIAQAIQQAFGTIDPKTIMTRVTNTQEFVTRLVDAMSKLPRAAETTTQKLSNLAGTVEHELARFGERFLPYVRQAVDWLEVDIPKAIDYLMAKWDSLSPTMRKVAVAFGVVLTAVGPVLTVVGLAIFAVGGFVAGFGALSSAAGGISVVLGIAGTAVGAVAAALVAGGLAVAAFYVAWRDNLGHIRGISAMVWEAVSTHVMKAAAIIGNAWLRLWPTLVSLTEKSLKAIEALWQSTSGSLIVAIQYVADILLPIIRGVWEHVLNLVELVARLADGDWKGAWDTFSIIVYNATQRWVDFYYHALAGIVARLFVWGDELEEAVKRMTVRVVAAIALEVGNGYPKIREALLTAFLLAGSTLNFAAVGALLMSGLSKAIVHGGHLVAEGDRAAIARSFAGQANDLNAQLEAALKKGAQPDVPITPNFTIDPTTALPGGKTTDPAIEQTRILQDQLAEVDKRASATLAKVERLYKFGIVGIAAYTGEAEHIETARFKRVNDILDQEYAVAQTKQKGAAAAMADVDKRRAEESIKHGQVVAKAEDDTLTLRLRTYEQAQEEYLRTQEVYDKRAIDNLRQAAELRQKTYGAAEEEINAIETRAYDRADVLLGKQQNLYATDSEQFIALALKRAEAAEREADRRLAAQARIIAGFQKDLDEYAAFDKRMSELESGNRDLTHDINSARIDQLARLGADPRFIEAQRALSATYDHYEEERANLIEQRTRDLATATGEQRTQIEENYHQRLLLLEEQHQVRMSDVMVVAMERYVQKVQHMAEAVGDIFGQAFGAIFDKSKSFWSELGQGFRQLWVQIVHDFIASRVKNYIESLFLPAFGATHGGGAVGGAGGAMSLAPLGLGALLAGGGAGGGQVNLAALTGGFAGGNPALSLLLGGGGGGAGGSTLQTPPSISAGRTGLTGLAALIFGRGAGNASGPWVDPAAFTAEFGLPPGEMAPGPFAGLGNTLGAMAPLLGLGLGSSLGGPSTLGRIGGGIGGALLGGSLAAFLTPGIFGTGAFASTIVPLLTNPFTIAAGVALLAGALILGRNAQRRRDETTRNTISNDTGTAIWALIDEARFGDVTLADATQKWNQIKNDYFSKIAAIKDSKTKHNAELQWTNDFAPLWNTLQAAVAGSQQRANIRNRMVPVFADGGVNRQTQVIRVRPGEGLQWPGSGGLSVVPGVDRGYDSVYMHAPAGLRVIRQSDMAHARPMQGGGTVGAGAAQAGRDNVLRVDAMEVNFDEDGLCEVVIRSPLFKEATIRNVKVGRTTRRIR